MSSNYRSVKKRRRAFFLDLVSTSRETVFEFPLEFENLFCLHGEQGLRPSRRRAVRGSPLVDPAAEVEQECHGGGRRVPHFGEPVRVAAHAAAHDAHHKAAEEAAATAAAAAAAAAAAGDGQGDKSGRHIAVFWSRRAVSVAVGAAVYG